MRGGGLLMVLLLLAGLVSGQEQAPSEIEKALSVLEKPPADPGRWISAAFMAAEFYKSNPRQAGRYLEDAVEIARKNKLPEFQADALVKLSILYREEKRSNPYLEEAIAIQRKLGNDKKVMSLSLQLAGGYLRQDQVKKAISLYEELLPEFRKSASRQDLVMALFNYGNAVYMARDYEKTLELGEVVTSISAKIPFDLMEQQGLLLQGKALQQLGQTEASLRVRTEALRKAEASRDLNLQTSALLDIADLLENLEDYPRAIPYLKKGIELGKNGDQPLKQVFLNIRMARVLILSGQAEAAMPYVNDAQELETTRNLKRKEAVQLIKGRVLYETGQTGRGIDLMQRSFLRHARHNAYVAGDRLIVATYFSEKGLYKQAEEQFAALEKDLPQLSEQVRASFRDAKQAHERRKKGMPEVVTRKPETRDTKRPPATEAEKTVTLMLEDSLRNAALSEQLALLASENKRKAAELKQSEFRFYLFLMALLLLLLSVAFGLFWYRNRKKQAERMAEKEKQIRALEQEEAERQKKLEVVDALLEGQEQERKRIAESLHDDVGSMLSALRLQLERFETEEKPASEQAHLTLRQAVDMLDHVATDVRNLSHVLMPTAIGKFGLRRAVELYVEQLNAVGKVHFELLITGLEQPLPEALELSSYRILLELCNNVLKHAQARNVVVQLVEHADQLVLMVEDNGKGFEPVDNSSDGIGLRTIESRIHHLQGRMEVDSAPGRGTHITVELPLGEA